MVLYIVVNGLYKVVNGVIGVYGVIVVNGVKSLMVL